MIGNPKLNPNSILFHDVQTKNKIMVLIVKYMMQGDILLLLEIRYQEKDINHNKYTLIAN